MDVASDAPSEFSRRRTRLVLRVLIAFLAGACLAVLVFVTTLPDVSPLKTGFPKTTAFMERRKSALARAGENSRLEWAPVPLSRISPRLARAVVAAEDARFYEHAGVDWEAVRGALEKDWGERACITALRRSRSNSPKTCTFPPGGRPGENCANGRSPGDSKPPCRNGGFWSFT